MKEVIVGTIFSVSTLLPSNASSTRVLVAEFVGAFPGVVPEQRGYPLVVEARSSRSDGWRRVLSFTLQLGNLIHPSNYIVLHQSARLTCTTKSGRAFRSAPIGRTNSNDEPHRPSRRSSWRA